MPDAVYQRLLEPEDGVFLHSVVAEVSAAAAQLRHAVLPVVLQVRGLRGYAEGAAAARQTREGQMVVHREES